VLVDELADGITLGGDDGHHLARVRRLRAGERVTAADGRGTWRAYAVVSVNGSALALEATGELCREPELIPGLVVAFALTKGVKPEIAVRQLTELGVDAVVPVHAERSVARPTGARERALTERLRRVAREAAMQSRRARLPEIGEPRAITALVGRAGLVVAERAPGSIPVPDDPAGGAWTLLVGPEGGFSPAELASLESAPRLGVGPHVLRAETAAVAGASLLTARRRRGRAGRSGAP